MKRYTGFQQYLTDIAKAKALDAKILTTQAKLRIVPPQARMVYMTYLNKLKMERKSLPGKKERVMFRVGKAPAYYMNSPVRSQSTWQTDVTYFPSTNSAIIFNKNRPCSFQKLRNFLMNRSLGQYFNKHFKGK